MILSKTNIKVKLARLAPIILISVAIGGFLGIIIAFTAVKNTIPLENYTNGLTQAITLLVISLIGLVYCIYYGINSTLQFFLKF